MPTQDNTPTLENILRSLLKLRYLTLGFTQESYTLRLVSVNAAIASARLGEQGNMFSTLTNEIASLTNKLEHLVRSICGYITELTGHMAKIVNNQRSIFYMQQSMSLLTKTHRTHTLLYTLYKATTSDNQTSLAMCTNTLVTLRKETNKLPEYIKFFNAIRTQLIVVIGAVTPQADTRHSGDTQTLGLLADSITHSCQNMTNILHASNTMLDNIQNMVGTVHLQNQKVTA